MRVIPVLDLADGRAVHARGGVRSSYAPVSSRLAAASAPGDPIALGRAYRAVLGLDELYVADLDAIAGRAAQLELLGLLAAESGSVWLDAGIASPLAARSALEAGAARVVVGLETLPARSALMSIIQDVGAERVVFSLDLRDGVPITRDAGLEGLGPLGIAELVAQAGARSMIVLDLARVGLGVGVDLALVRQLRRVLPPTAELFAGGGIATPHDLARLEDAGATGALVASALHDGRIGAAELGT